MDATIYARFSPRPNASESESIATQLERCGAYCRARAWAPFAQHEDRELSGKRADNRPGLQAAIADACRSRGVLVVYSLSRLARSTRDAIDIAERLSKAGAELASLHENVDTTTASGRLFFTIISAFAQFEREVIGERTSDAMRRHQSSGRRMSFRVPYGKMPDPLDSTRIVDCPIEKAVLENILILGGKIKTDGLEACDWTPAQIAKKLNRQGYACRGKPWHRNTIGRILARAAG